MAMLSNVLMETRIGILMGNNIERVVKPLGPTGKLNTGIMFAGRGFASFGPAVVRANGQN